jgi:glycosyltransferase involved in cell wall biosynthesis
MHVLILPMYYPEPGAPAHRGYMFYEQAMQIAHSGCKVGLAYTEQRLPKTFSWKVFRKENHFQITHEDNGTFITMRMHAWNPKLSTRPGGIIWSLLTLLLVSRYIHRYGKPDIIHAHFGTWAGYAANLVYKCYGIPYVVTEHASSINGGKVTPAQAATLKKAYHNAKKVICVGTLLKKNLTPYLDNPDKAVVIPNFVDISTFSFSNRHTEKEKQFRFVSIGNLSKRKGFDELIEAFNQDFRGQTHISLTIVGDGEETDHLQNKIHELNLEQQITLTGRLSRDKVALLLSQCDAFVLASYAETFGIVFIEAMATGMPSIGTICGGPEDIITPESGYLIQPGDVSILAVKMKQLYDNYDQFDKSKIRQSVAERFDFNLAGQKLKDIYQQ